MGKPDLNRCCQNVLEQEPQSLTALYDCKEMTATAPALRLHTVGNCFLCLCVSAMILSFIYLFVFFPQYAFIIPSNNSNRILCELSPFTSAFIYPLGFMFCLYSGGIYFFKGGRSTLVSFFLSMCIKHVSRTSSSLSSHVIWSSVL